MNATGHVYLIADRSWFCPRCDTDCGQDDIPCDCCFDDVPAVTYSDGRGESSKVGMWA